MSNVEPMAVVPRLRNRSARPVPRQSVVITCGAVSGPQLLALMEALDAEAAASPGAAGSWSAPHPSNAVVSVISATVGMRVIDMIPPRDRGTARDGVASWIGRQARGGTSIIAPDSTWR